MNSPTPPSANVPEPHLVQVDPPNPWRPLIVPAVVVIVGLAIAGLLFSHYGRSKADASGQILRNVVYPVQVDAAVTQPDSGMAGSVPEQDEIVLLVQARITNVSHRPLRLFDMTATVKSPQGNFVSTAALPEDIDRLLQRFPDLAKVNMQPLTRNQVIAPGQSTDGLLVFSYPWTKQAWDQHKQAQVTISFEKGRSLILPLQ